MCAPSPPPAPDYGAAAQAQSQANVTAAQQQGVINNPNVVNPYGTQTTSWAPLPLSESQKKDFTTALQNYSRGIAWTDANGQVHTSGGPPTEQSFTGGQLQPTLTQTLNPNEQQILTSGEQAKIKLSDLAGQGATAAQGVVGKPVDFSGLPAAPVPGQVNQAIVDAMMKRPMADYQRAKDQSSSDLAAAGIPVGSTAYNTQNDLLNRQLTDAQTQAELAGVSAGQTEFNQGQTARNQAITELLAQRQVPLNEVTALMSGSQVSNPFAVPGYAQNASVGAAPVFGAAQQAANYGTDIYNVGAQQAGNLQSGLFGLAGSGAMAYGLKK